MDQSINSIKERYTLFAQIRKPQERSSVSLTMNELKERIRNLKDDEILSVQMIEHRES